MKKLNILSALLRLNGNVFTIRFRPCSRAGFCICLILLAAFAVAAQIPQPKDVLGFTPGDDKKLASWAQTLEYFKRLNAASDRVMLQEIGKTTIGAPFVYATISSPENLKNLEKYKQINAQLADPRTFKSNDAVAKRLIAEGKTIVLITCGIHSTEVGSYLSSMLIAYKLATANDAATKKILDNTIILLVPSLNPDGVDIVKNWYDKTLGTKFEGTDPPELYNKYVGHDNNRDWYAFTQVETQLTVDKIHNVWKPQIVNDIHQQGQNGSRLFLPPYMQPVEPNVPKQIVEGYTELGNYMAADLRKQGFQGITTNSTYDAWTPSRAYSHYHGGVRILSETASAKLATPVNIKFEDLRPGLGFDSKKETDNFGPVWRGGEWNLRNITSYMTTAAFSLLSNAANNRERWLSRFYEIGKEAVRPRKDGELFAVILPPVKSTISKDSDNFERMLDAPQRRGKFIEIMQRAGVEVEEPLSFQVDGKRYPRGTAVLRIDQPYGDFVKALVETQTYPNLQDENGNPITPYDVTAQTLPLLMGVPVIPVSKKFLYRTPNNFGGSGGDSRCGVSHPWRDALYKSATPNMDEGWTRWILEKEYSYPNCSGEFGSIGNEEIRKGIEGIVKGYSPRSTRSIIFPDQPPNQILNGYAKGSMPDEYTGGVGREGVENLRKFVEAGGTLVFLNRASDFAIEQFNLPVKDVTKGLPRKDFYIPGSILRTELDLTSPIAKGMPKESIAWFENGPAFEVLTGVGSPRVKEGSTGQTEALTDVRAADTVRVIARYPSDPSKILLSGWALGAEKIAGKATLVEVTMGKGKIILFGFRPQYRGQSLATFPLLFNAIAH